MTLQEDGMVGQEQKRACMRQPSYYEAVTKEQEAKEAEAGGKEQEKKVPSAPERDVADNGVRRRGLHTTAGEVMGLSDIPEKVFTKEVAPDLLAGHIEVGDKGAEDSDDPDEVVDRDWLADEDDFQRPAKLELIVGFLRLFSFISVCTSVFAVILSILFPIQQTETVILSMWRTVTTFNDTISYLEDEVRPNPNYPARDLLFYLRCTAGVIQLAYLFVNASFVIIDSIGTVTFRWKEYGELTHRHTDATSIMFLVSKSRWKQRFLAALTVASATSLQTAQIILNYYGRGPQNSVHKDIPEKAVHAVIWYLSLMMAGLVSMVFGFILYLIPADWRDVPWLDDKPTEKHIDDKDDRWKSFRDLAVVRHQKRELELDSVSSTVPLKPGLEEDLPISLESNGPELTYTYKHLTCFGFVLETQKRVVYFVAYIVSITMNLYTLLLIDLKTDSFESWTVLLSTVCNSLISLYLVILICIQCFRIPTKDHPWTPQSTPFLSKIYVPFTLSCSFRILLDINLELSQKYFFAYFYIILLSVYVFLHFVGLFTRRWAIKEPINNFVHKFFRFNFITSEGAYKKFVRVFDTMGGFLGLLGLILGIFSLLCDQYDLEFELDGGLKEVSDNFQDFYGKVKSTVDKVNKIIDSIDWEITCDKIYKVIGGGALAGFVTSIIPGASSAVSIGTKSTYYTVKAGSALSNLANTLRGSIRTMYNIAKITTRVAKFSFGNFKKFTIGGSSMTLLRLLPFLPPVVVGIHVLFSSFWPQRILFFSTSQRRTFIQNQKNHWFMILFLLILAVTINTVLIFELQAAFNDSLPFLNVHIKTKLGWNMSMAATAFSMASAVSFYISYWILGANTHIDHENLTNEEREWKAFVESKKKVTYYNAFGAKIEWKNQIKYKKERIGPWTWALPICLCLLACGLGVVANLYPKLDMVREPKGAFGRALDKVMVKIGSYEENMKSVKGHGELECVPFASFNDVLRENMNDRENILMRPIYSFFNATDLPIKRMKEIVSRTRKQFISDIGDELFGEEVSKQIREFDKLDLQYLGMILLIPKAIQLLILLVGMFAMSCATCDINMMVINPTYEPRRIVKAFGRMCMFSLVYNIFSQVAVFNILTDIGIPFYKIYISWGLGFMYDIASEAIMWSIWIGMNNEFFFAIPRKKKTVTYSVPGVSDGGPNVQNRVL